MSEMIFHPYRPPVTRRFEVVEDAAPIAGPRYSWPEECVVDEEEWLVEGLVPAKSYMGLFGRRGSAKSFLALDLAMCGALGLPFLGRQTERFASLYCVGEKAARFHKRVVAWSRERGLIDATGRPIAPPAPMLLRWSTPNLLDEAEMAAFADEVNAVKPRLEARGAPLKVVILDTLARSIRGGNVSDAVVAGIALHHINAFVEATGVTVIPVAHVAKAQGADSFKGAGEWENDADALLRVERKEGGQTRVVTNTKQSDGKDGDRWAFELDQVAVGVNRHGQPITSCVVRGVEVDGEEAAERAPRKPPRPRALTTPAGIVKAALNRLLDDGRAELVPPFVGVPSAQRGARLDPLREAAFALDLDRASEPPEDCEPRVRSQWQDRRRKSFQRGLDKLAALRIVRQEGGWVWFL